VALHITGIVTENGTPVVRIVRLYLRETGELVAEEYSSTSGEFSFVDLAEFAEGIEFYAIALDDDAGEAFNAIIWDRVTPVSFVPPTHHRYWRINGINLPGGSHLEISELHLFTDSTDVTANATISASHTTSFGSVSSLVDNNTSTRCHWPAATVEGGSFSINFDFGFEGEVQINGVKQAGYNTNDRYMESFTLQHSDNNTDWTTLGSKTGLTYPGNNTYSSLYSFT